MAGHGDPDTPGQGAGQLFGHDHAEYLVGTHPAVGGVVTEPQEPHRPQLFPERSGDLPVPVPFRDVGRGLGGEEFPELLPELFVLARKEIVLHVSILSWESGIRGFEQ